MLYTISYDIRDDRRRNKIHKLLKDFGNPVQFSVFEANLDADQFERLLDRVGKILDEEQDSLRVYPLCAGCREKIEIIGQGEVVQDPDFIII